MANDTADNATQQFKARIFLSNGSEVDTAGKLTVAQTLLSGQVMGWPTEVTFQGRTFNYDPRRSGLNQSPCYVSLNDGGDKTAA